MLDALLVPAGCGRHRAYIVGASIRVRTNCGDGELKYLVSDGFAGVKLDGEPSRVDEFPLAGLSSADRFVVALHSGNDVAYVATPGKEQSEYGFTFDRDDAREYTDRVAAQTTVRELRAAWPGQRFVVEVV